MGINGHCILSTSLTTINAGIWRCRGSFVNLIESLMIVLLQILRIFVENHWSLLERVRSDTERL